MIRQKLNKLQLKISVYPKVIISESEKILSRNSDKIEKFIIEELSKGLDGDGEKIGDRKPYRNPKYADRKNALNPLPGRGNPDLKLRGDFYAGIEVQVSGQDLLVDGNDIKTKNLETKYGNVVGFSPFVRDRIVNEILRPELTIFTSNYFK